MGEQSSNQAKASGSRFSCRTLLYVAVPVSVISVLVVVLARNSMGWPSSGAKEVLDPCSQLHAQCNSSLKFVTLDTCSAECKDPCTSIGRCLVDPSPNVPDEAEEDGLEEVDEALNETQAESDWSDSAGSSWGAQRLVKGYHQTSKEICRMIMQSDFRLGHGGWCGGAIYFATSPQATVRKAIAPSSHDGCMIEATIDVGKQAHFARGRCGVKNEQQLHKMQCDSVIYHAGDGDEIVVYDPARVVSKQVLPYKESWRVNSLRRRRQGN